MVVAFALSPLFDDALILVIALSIESVPPGGGKGPFKLFLDDAVPGCSCAGGGSDFGRTGSSNAGGGSTAADGPITRDRFDGGGIMRSIEDIVELGPGGSRG